MTTVCVVGGGVHVATLIGLMADAIDVPSLEVRIVARNRRRLETIGAYCSASVAERRPGWSIDVFTERTAGLDGADVVVALARVGGLAARQHDETFPVRVGQVGDEGLGLGGISNTWRTVPFLETLRHEISTCAPAAPVLNLMAPLATTTRCFTEHGLRASGVCELPLASQRKLGSAAGTMAYGGVNHLGWFCPGTDDDWRLVDAVVRGGIADAATVERFEAIPLYYYYRLFDPAAAARLGCAFVPGRAQALAGIAADAEREMRSGPAPGTSCRERRTTPWFDLALVPVLSAALTGAPHHAFANAASTVPSSLGLPPGTIVETRARWGEGGPEPEPMPELPGAVAGFLRAVAESDDLAYRAARERDTTRLRRAVEALPLEMCSDEVDYAVERIVAGAALGEQGALR